MSLAFAPAGSAPASASASAASVVAERVRERLRGEGADPARDPQLALSIAQTEVRRHNDFALARGLVPVDDEAACVREVLASVAGYGPLQPYLDDPTVEELWINAPDRIFIARGGVSERVPLALTDAAVRDLVERMLHATGRRVDLSQPFVDASLPDGSRLHVVIPDITRRHWSVNVRKFLPAYRDLERLVAAGSIEPAAAALLRGAMASGRSVLVSGATHAGKTTLLGALIAACPRHHRIVTVEETFELGVDAPDLVSLQGRQPSLEGSSKRCCIRCHIRGRSSMPAIPGVPRRAERVRSIRVGSIVRPFRRRRATTRWAPQNPSSQYSW